MAFDPIAAGAHARGLATHLATRAELEALAGADVEALAAALGRGGRLEPIAAPVTAAGIEQAARRTAARHLALLARWDAAPALEVFRADQERRALRALLRGAAASEPAEDRLAGLVPTPLLPESALVALAHEPTAARVAAHLVVLAYPGAAELAELASRAHPVLFELELALLRAFAARLARASSSADANLRGVIAWKMDVTNAMTALTIARNAQPGICVQPGSTGVSIHHAVASSSMPKRRLTDSIHAPVRGSRAPAEPPTASSGTPMPQASANRAEPPSSTSPVREI